MTDFINGPAIQPPPGTVPQLDHPPGHRVMTNFFCIFSIVLTTLVVSVRLYSRAFITRIFGYPEYLIFVGYGLFMGFCGMCLVASSIAPGLHSWDLRLIHLRPFLYVLHVDTILYGVAILAIKLSILAQFFPIFMPFKEPRSLYWSTIGSMVLNTVFYTTLSCLQIWACSPMRKAWDPFITDGHCININSLTVAYSAVNIVTDTIIFLLPQASIWRLTVPFRTKAAYASIFLVGLFSISAATIRLYYSATLMRSADIVWYTWIMGMTALVEIDFGFLCACMPAVPAFVRWATREIPWRQLALIDNKRRSGFMQQNSRQNHEEHTNQAQEGFYTRAYGSPARGFRFISSRDPETSSNE